MNFPIMASFNQASAEAKVGGFPPVSTFWITEHDVQALAEELREHGQLPANLRALSRTDDKILQEVIRKGQLVFNDAVVRVAVVSSAQ